MGLKNCQKQNLFSVKQSDSFSLIFFFFYLCVCQTSAQAEAENQKALRQTVLPGLSWLN